MTMRVLFDFKTLYEELSKFDLSTLAYWLGEGFELKDAKEEIQWSFYCKNSDVLLQLPLLAIKETKGKNYLYIVGREEFTSGSYFYYLLMELLKELGIKRIFWESGATFLYKGSLPSKKPKFFLGTDFFSLGNNSEKKYMFSF
jgi:hypothetical protein